MSTKYIISKQEKRFIRREMINSLLRKLLSLGTIKKQARLQERTYYGQEMKVTR